MRQKKMWMTAVAAWLKIIKKFEHTNCIRFKYQYKYIKIDSKNMHKSKQSLFYFCSLFVFVFSFLLYNWEIMPVVYNSHHALKQEKLKVQKMESTTRVQ